MKIRASEIIDTGGLVWLQSSSSSWCLCLLSVAGIHTNPVYIRIQSPKSICPNESLTLWIKQSYVTTWIMWFIIQPLMLKPIFFIIETNKLLFLPLCQCLPAPFQIYHSFPFIISFSQSFYWPSVLIFPSLISSLFSTHFVLLSLLLFHCWEVDEELERGMESRPFISWPHSLWLDSWRPRPVVSMGKAHEATAARRQQQQYTDRVRYTDHSSITWTHTQPH